MRALIPDHARSRVNGFSNDNEYFLDYNNRHFYDSAFITGSTTIRVPVQRNDPQGWLGFGTRAELLARATAVGDWGYDTDLSGTNAVIYLTSFDGWRCRISVTGQWVFTASGSSGIAQVDADARYVNVTGDTMTGGLHVQPHQGTIQAFIVTQLGDTHSAATLKGLESNNSPVLKLEVNNSGLQKYLQVEHATDTVARLSISGAVGGMGNRVGFEFGGGSANRDTNLYRKSANQLETDDGFHG